MVSSIIFALLQNQQSKQLSKKCGLRSKRGHGKNSTDEDNTGSWDKIYTQARGLKYCLSVNF